MIGPTLRQHPCAPRYLCFLLWFLQELAQPFPSTRNLRGTQWMATPCLATLRKKSASKKAREMAETDFAQNVYRIFVAGKPAGRIASDEYLTNKYGVHVTSIAGCLISDGIEGAIDGYNSTMKPLLNRKFGHDIFKEAEEANRR